MDAPVPATRTMSQQLYPEYFVQQSITWFGWFRKPELEFSLSRELLPSHFDQIAATLTETFRHEAAWNTDSCLSPAMYEISFIMTCACA